MKKQDNKQRLFEMMGRLDKTFKPKLNENYSDYLDTNYSADGMEDYNADKETQRKAEELYGKGLELFNGGDVEGAEKLRQDALRISSSLGWGEKDLPQYSQEITEYFKKPYSTYGKSGDPRIITLKYDTTCAETGKPIKAGEKAIYYPRTKDFFCMDSKQAQEFHGWKQDMDMGYDY